MRWLTGWSGGASGAGAPAHDAPSAVTPIAARALWTGPNPLWAVGDWRPEEIRLVTLRPGAPAVVTTGPFEPPGTANASDGRGLGPDQAGSGPTDLHRAGRRPTDPRPSRPRPTDPRPTGPHPAEDTPATTRLAVLGHCAATDAELVAGLAAARGGAVRHLTHWPGSYTVVLRTGTRSTVLLTDLAGAQPVFHVPWAGGTAYATAALPLADLVGAPVDTGHLAARLACPESPEALGTSTPYLGVRRVPPGHSLGIRDGRPYTSPYDEPAGQVQGRGEAPAVRELTRALLESVRSRVRTTAPATAATTAGRARLGADLSYGTGSATVALLAAAVPIGPVTLPARTPATTGPAGGPRTGAVKGSWARGPARGPNEPEPLAAVTQRESEGAATLALDSPRLRHTLLADDPATLPYAGLAADVPGGRLTDEPGPELVAAVRAEARLSAGGTDHLTGHGARQVLDGHPARLADLVRTGRTRELLPPVAALAGADRAAAGVLTGALRTPLTVLRAAHRLSRARYADALEDAAVRLTLRRGGDGGATAGSRSAGDLAWCVPGPAARWLSDEALSAVALRLRLAAREPAPAENPGARRARYALHRHAAAFRTLTHLAEQPGQRLHAPFLDNQVIRAARLLPDEIRLQPGARPALLRAVLTGAGRTDLPPDWGRTPRPDRTAPARAGLRLAADGLAELFDAPLLAEAGLIDLPAVRTALARAARADAALPPAELAGLADLVSTELWLRRVRARRHGACWTGLPLPERAALAAPYFA
ncbi:asparagine synthase-related protein [Kitasatospora sp. NPDC004240]